MAILPKKVFLFRGILPEAFVMAATCRDRMRKSVHFAR
jgi:hypothetical protein